MCGAASHMWLVSYHLAHQQTSQSEHDIHVRARSLGGAGFKLLHRRSNLGSGALLERELHIVDMKQAEPPATDLLRHTFD